MDYSDPKPSIAPSKKLSKVDSVDVKVVKIFTDGFTPSPSKREKEDTKKLDSDCPDSELI